MNVPTSTHDHRMPELVRTLRNQNTIVFHCALSQQRGPSSALRYLRERERMSARGELGIREDGKDLEKAQRVVVLDGGFEKWQAACVMTATSEEARTCLLTCHTDMAQIQSLPKPTSKTCGMRTFEGVNSGLACCE